MSTPLPPLSGAGDIEALAERLSACADALHARLMKAIRAATTAAPAPAGPQPARGASIDQGLSQGAAQALFENEVALRQRANGLYLDAATLAASGLAGAEQQLLALTAQAAERIRTLDRLRDLIDLAAELLQLGAAVASGAPEHLAAPLEKIKQHLADLNNPTPAPPA
ncbi:hypothetical protein H3H37_03025 [Duganella sp. LX20W]|uniref:Uncharacterized protein n=1 Tax=Rugamonas brunnea TaxID=2758569 RepID=A0A7W2EP57_9BURK|nr:hypothetical protein [Rugamonas brunnea]MBA5636021.1 hypothetical protein [Rugamonas brunnea]